MQKTLGGDRLGAGNKMKVNLPGFERSTHDLGYLFRTTMAPGTLVPFISKVALPGDTWDIDLDAHVNTHPTVGPLFGSYKMQMDIFECPFRLYQALLHNNMLGIGRNMAQVKLPLMEFEALELSPLTTKDLDNSQINPSALPAYLGTRGLGDPGATTAARQINAIPYLAYWEIYKNYYSNKQEEIGAVIHNDNITITTTVTAINLIRPGITNVALPKVPPGVLAYTQMIAVGFSPQIQIAFTGAEPLPEQIYVYLNSGGTSILLSDLAGTFTLTAAGILTSDIKTQYIGQYLGGWNYQAAYDITNVKPIVATFPLSNIDDMRNDILQAPGNLPFILSAATAPEPYVWLLDHPNGVPNILSSQEGLALKTYNSDLLNNWLKTENIDAITTASSIDTTGGSFNMDTLAMAKNVYKYLNAINVSGGTYDDWLEVTYDHQMILRAESPIYCGGLVKEIVFQEVVSNSASEDQPLGTLAGRGTLSGKHKGGKIVVRVNEPSYIIGLVSITPRIDYSQGNTWDVNLKTMDDLHKPQFDQIGFQDLNTEQMAWWDVQYTGGEWVYNSAGKQPAWTNYMTEINRNYGNFAIQDNEMFMTLNRRYENDTDPATIKDLTTYIDPSKYNYIFAETSLDAQNFWVQMSVDITARRKMSAKIMPSV